MTSFTCCDLLNNEWGCCQYDSATCCSDHAHCCPPSYDCDASRGACVFNKLKRSQLNNEKSNEKLEISWSALKVTK
jgi:hypothetical protein